MDDNPTVWSTFPQARAIAPGEIHIWKVGLTMTPADVRHYRGFLLRDERDKADRFHFDKDRDRFTVSRGVLRQLLGTFLPVAPSDVAFVYGPQGKPALARPQSLSGLCFNLSHSHEIALIAIALNLDLGIDIEHVHADFATGEIASRFFSPAECARLAALPSAAQIDAFFNCWTRKEAYIKARGQGLSIPLDSFEVAFAPGEEAALLKATAGDDASRWSMHALHASPGYKAALAAESRDHELYLWEFKR